MRWAIGIAGRRRPATGIPRVPPDFPGGYWKNRRNLLGLSWICSSDVHGIYWDSLRDFARIINLDFNGCYWIFLGFHGNFVMHEDVFLRSHRSEII